LTWQDWTRFKKENTGAETIFYAAQNQFSELAATGMYEEKVYGVLSRLGNDIGRPENHRLFDGSKIKYDSGSTDYYKWEPDGSSNGIAIWANTPGEVSSSEKAKYQGSIYYLSAKKGDYDRYLKEPDFGVNVDDAGAKLLFDLIAPYISEKSVLNGAIILEFSPEARQVFSVCYSDRIDELTHAQLATNSKALSSVRDRSEDTRRDLMLGYFAAQSLSVPLEGMGKTVLSNVELRNEYALKLVIREDTISYNEPYMITLCNAPGGIVDSNSKLMTFEFTPATTITEDPAAASKKPQTVTIRFKAGTHIGEDIQMRIPVWKETTLDGKIELILALDAADVQAQSFLYAEDTTMDSAFLTTYSFYRYGFNMDEITSVGCLVSKGAGDSVSKSNAECPTFKEINKNGLDAEYTIENGRHLYNVRYETDWEKGDINKTFRLTTDIDWEDFTGVISTVGNEGKNWFFDSLDVGTPSGISYDGVELDINRGTHAGTAGYAFPGFRSLGSGDVFTGLPENADDTTKPFTISDLTITFSGNMRYGVYGKASREEWIDKKRKLNTFGVYDTQTVYGGAHPTQERVVRGELPLGLFAENAGDITGLRLNKHRVVGEEILHDAVNGGDVLVYTNMVGGFTGDNLGRLSNLTLRDTTNPDGDDLKADEAGVSLVTGKTDVGGIVGRQSWTLTDSEVNLTKLYNYASVKGMENVGGIVGRAYAIRSFTSRGNDLATYNSRKAYYSDPYTIFGSFDDNGGITAGTSITGKQVVIADKITIENCHNRGYISGSSDFNNLHNEAQKRGIYDESEVANDVMVSKRMLQRCANIGGIAGITMDGYFLENKNKYSNKYWYDFIENEELKVNVKNCDSYHLYTDAEWSEVRSVSGKSNITNEEIRNSIEHDYYVGGLVGYARLTQFTDCSNNKKADNEGNYESFVFGRNYVGGMFGCFDGSRITKSTNQGRYNAENYVNTIGIMYVGGFSGSFGIGAEDITKISFRYPSENTGSEATPIPGDDKPISGICNHAVVLGVKREMFTDDYKNGKFLYAQDRAITGGVTKSGTRAVSGAPDSSVGGVIGLAASKFTDFDNLQDASAKKLALQLSGFDDITAGNMNIDAHSLETVQNYSLYGGNAVGGIVGKILNNVDVNTNKNSYCEVNAVVWGGDSTGGIWGATSNASSNNKVNVYNSYVNGALVLGRDMVGGIGGRGTAGFNLNAQYVNNAYIQNHPAHIIGRYAVGGAFGYTGVHSVSSTTINAWLDGGESKIIVEGIVAVGGFSGAVGSVSTYEGYVKNATVKADFYAGGVFGVMYNEYDASYDKTGDPAVQLSTKNLYAEDVNVTADRAFAGGYCGLYQYRNEHIFNSGNTNTSDDFCLVYPIFKAVTGYKNDENAFMKFIDETLVLQQNYAGIVSVVNESENNALGTLNPKMGTVTKEQTFPIKPVRGGSVTANMFAGGVFGYLPNGLKFTFKLGGTSMTGNTDVTTKEYITPASLPNAWMEKNAGNSAIFGERRFSYAGGVVGRIPMGCIIDSASYQGVIKSEKGTYLGQIAEVSEGTVQNCTISGYRSGISKNTFTGGAVGLNSINGVMGTGNSFFDGQTLGMVDDMVDNEAREIVGGFAGENISPNLKMENVRFVDGNLKAIQGKTAAGLICGYNAPNAVIDTYSAGNTVITSAVKMVNTPYVGVYAGINAGTITNSKINKNVSELTAEEIVNNSLNAELHALNCDYAGLLSGRNIGTISNICINGADGDRKGRINIKADNDITYKYIGGLVGQNGEGNTTGTIQNCITTMPVGYADKADKIGTAAGFAAFINGNSIITGCINKGDIFGKDNAAGIAGKAATSLGNTPSVTFENCINMGTISVTEANGKSAGIAVGTNNEGIFTLCRNYGTGAKFGISAENVKGMTKCLESSGLNEGTETELARPLAPNDNDANFARNFYVWGTTDNVTVPDAPQPTGEQVVFSVKVGELYEELATITKPAGWDNPGYPTYIITNDVTNIHKAGIDEDFAYIYSRCGIQGAEAILKELYAYYVLVLNKPADWNAFCEFAKTAIKTGTLDGSGEIDQTATIGVNTNAINIDFNEYSEKMNDARSFVNQYNNDFIKRVSLHGEPEPYLVYFFAKEFDNGQPNDLDQGYLLYITKVASAYLATHDEALTVDNFIPYLQQVISEGRIPGSGGDTTPDNSHWPVQLYYYGEDGTKGLYFKRKYYHFANIASDTDPTDIENTTAEGRFNLVDAQFVTMVNKTEGQEGYIPNYSADDYTAPVGFVKQ